MNAAPLYRYTRSALFPPSRVPLFIERACHNTLEAAHDHDFMEVAFVVSGSAQHHSSQGIQPLAAGDVVVLRPGAWHAYLDCQTLVVCNCCFGAEVLRQALAVALDDPPMNHLFRVGPLSAQRHGLVISQMPPDAVRRCETLFSTLEQLLADPDDARRTRVVLHLLLFLEEVAAHLSASPEDNPPVLKRTSTAVAHAVQLLEDDIARGWTIPELAEHLNLAPAYFVRVFKPATGLPPMAYLARLRAERAAELLIRTPLSVAQIAVEVGWPSPYYFARRFKAHFGMTASEYRTRFARPV